MENHNEQYEKLIKKFTSWALGCEDIRAALIVGSRARQDQPADQWSDLDLVMFAGSPDDYINSASWLENMGPYWITFIEDTAVGGGKERRVLFDGGLDVDFSVFPVRAVYLLSDQLEVKAVFQRGFRVLFDKDHLLADGLFLAGDMPDDKSADVSDDMTSLVANHWPTEAEFINLVNDFWYHAVWGIKKLRRGEMWMAKSNVDNYLKWQILKLCEWHAKAMHGLGYDTWHGGRYFEKWVDPRIKEELVDAFAYYDENDIVRALQSTMRLFRWVAVETAEKLAYHYPALADAKATEWIEESVGS